MKYALAAVGFINEDIEYNKAVLADTLRKCAGRADVVIFGEAFLRGFYGINFIAKHDTTVSISRDDIVCCQGPKRGRQSMQASCNSP